MAFSRVLHLRSSLNATVPAVFELYGAVPKPAHSAKQLLPRQISLVALQECKSQPLLTNLWQQLHEARGPCVLRGSAQLPAAASEVRRMQWLTRSLHICWRGATLTLVTDSGRDSAEPAHGRCAISATITFCALALLGHGPFVPCAFVGSSNH